MTPWRFYGECLRRAFRGGWATSEKLSFLLTLVGGLVAYLTELGEVVNLLLWALPLAVFVGTIVIGFLWNTYLLYREENTKRADTEKLLAEATAEPDDAALRRLVSKLIDQGNCMVKWLMSGRYDLEQEAISELRLWDKKTRRAVKRYCSEHYPEFLNNPHKDDAEGAQDVLTPNVAGVRGYVEEQLRKFCRIFDDALAQ